MGPSIASHGTDSEHYSIKIFCKQMWVFNSYAKKQYFPFYRISTWICGDSLATPDLAYLLF